MLISDKKILNASPLHISRSVHQKHPPPPLKKIIQTWRNCHHQKIQVQNYPHCVICFQVVVVVNHCFMSLFGTKGLLSDIVLR